MIDCNIVPEEAIFNYFLLLKLFLAEKLAPLEYAVEIIGKLNTVDASVTVVEKSVD
jgi:hypothetical protein